MHLVALAEGWDHVCSRYRLEAFRPWLERAGHALRVFPWPRSLWAWLRLGRELPPADALLIQRKLPSLWQLEVLRRLAPRLLFDFDDAVFLRDSFSPRGPDSGRRLRRFKAVLRASDVVVAGNGYLQAQACAWMPGGRVHVVPTCAEPAKYPLAEHRRRGRGVQLVWIGSFSTLQGLEQVRDLLENLGRGVPGVCLKLICDRFLELRQLPVLACRWSEAREGVELAAADIGMSWMPDDRWSRGKCCLKVVQYMAAGLPVVANPVGVHAEMVRHGETGFLARTPGEWTEAIGRLAADPDLRRRMGRAGRQVVEERYSVAAGAERWLALLDELGRRRMAA